MLANDKLCLAHLNGFLKNYLRYFGNGLTSTFIVENRNSTSITAAFALLFIIIESPLFVNLINSSRQS